MDFLFIDFLFNFITVYHQALEWTDRPTHHSKWPAVSLPKTLTTGRGYPLRNILLVFNTHTHTRTPMATIHHTTPTEMCERKEQLCGNESS